MKINTCPLRDAYMFKNKCNISTCKYFTENTARRCLSLDIRFAASDKVSDSELRLYKFPAISPQKIAQLRKMAVIRAENVVRLYVLVGKIEHEQKVWEYVPCPILDTILDRKPLRIRKLGFEPWMLYYLFNREYVVKHAGIEPHELLWMKEYEYQTVAQIIRSSTDE